MNYEERSTQHQRLMILKALSRRNDGRLNERDIQDDLDLYGHRLARPEVRALLDWLEAAGAVRLTRPGEVIVVAELTQRGADHLERRGEPVDGILLPSRA